jgi:hypothetical protein
MAAAVYAFCVLFLELARRGRRNKVQFSRQSVIGQDRGGSLRPSIDQSINQSIDQSIDPRERLNGVGAKRTWFAVVVVVVVPAEQRG